MVRNIHLFAVTGLILTVAVWDQAAAAPPKPASATQCRGPDSLSDDLISYLRFLVTATDSETIATRKMWGLPVTSSSKVTLVTDARTCARAADAYSADEDTTHATAGRPAYVIRVLNVYVVWDPAVHVGEWSAYRTMDSKFKVTASVAG